MCRHYLGMRDAHILRRPLYVSEGMYRWSVVYQPQTPLLDIISLDSRDAVCELMQRLSLDPHPDHSSDALSLRCSCEALVARIERELHMRALERPSRLSLQFPAQNQVPNIVKTLHKLPTANKESSRSILNTDSEASISTSASQTHATFAAILTKLIKMPSINAAPVSSDRESAVSSGPTAPQSAQCTIGNMDTEDESKSGASASEETRTHRRLSRKRRRPAKQTDSVSDTNSSALIASAKERETASDAELQPEYADSSSKSIVRSVSVSREELNGVENLSVITEAAVCAESPVEESDLFSFGNCSSTPLAEELPALNEDSTKYCVMLEEIRKDLAKFIAVSKLPKRSLLPPNRLMRARGKFHIRTGFGIRDSPEQLIRRILKMERDADIMSTSVRVAQHLLLSDSEKAAMDALALVSVAMYLRAPIDFHTETLASLLAYVQAVEGNAEGIDCWLDFTNGEAYRLLRLYLLLNLSMLGPFTRSVFSCATMRSEQFYPLQWLSDQLDRDFLLDKDPFVAFVSALNHVDAMRQYQLSARASSLLVS